ncbi:hypothetical protein [Pseudomonas sp. FEN]|uniref:hypothetical protein n=1 Tax=Pseudomonas sp. FEN TaxID=2767468 RepID=UPI00174B0B77|nr:hypothetical protein [Pseudomonas sp. FEN]
MHPYFEFDVLQGIATNQGAAIERAIEKYGIGVMVQERFGDPDGFQKDLMYDFRVGGNDEEALCTGRRMMHASLAYIFHFSNESRTGLNNRSNGNARFIRRAEKTFVAIINKPAKIHRGLPRLYLWRNCAFSGELS